MNNKMFAEKALNVAKNFKTSYLLGGIGQIATQNNLNKLLTQYENNYNWANKARAIIGHGFYFDCSGLVKAIIWGWNANPNLPYGGAIYASNGMPDVNDEGLKAMCSDVSSNFSNIQIGSLLFTSGHVGIYIGSGKAVEATPAWNGGVQISAVGNIGAIPGLPTRTWSTYGKLRLISYTTQNSVPSPTPSQKVAYAKFLNKAYEKTYTVSATGGLRMRADAGTQHGIIKTLPNHSIVTCYGYFSKDSKNEDWLYVKDSKGVVGFCKKEFLI